MSKTILIVEDEADVTDLLRYHLRKGGYRILSARDGEEGLRVAFAERPSVLLLDIMMPRFNGFELLRQLRSDARGETAGVLVLSAKGDVESRVRALELGADDYVTKPFSPRELILRVQALLRRRRRSLSENLTAGPLVLDRSALFATLEGVRIDLTPIEFKLLLLLVSREGEILPRTTLLQEVWGGDVSENTRTLDSTMRRLREKLGEHEHLIGTVWGKGYRFLSQG